MLLEATAARDWDGGASRRRTARATTGATRWTSTKISNELGYAPASTFEDGLAETVAWYRDNRAWWEPLKTRAAPA